MVYGIDLHFVGSFVGSMFSEHTYPRAETEEKEERESSAELLPTNTWCARVCVVKSWNDLRPAIHTDSLQYCSCTIKTSISLCLGIILSTSCHKK